MRRTVAKLALLATLSLVLTGIQTGVGVATHTDENGNVQSPFPDRTVTVTPANSPQTWEGKTASGANTEYNGQTGEPCGKTPADYCDITLLHVDVPADYWDTRGGGVRIRIGDYTGVSGPTSDFDLYVYESNAQGHLGRLVGSSAAVPGAEEETTITEARGYYLIQVVYFAVVESNYTGSAEFLTRSEIPPDVDNPPGLQEVLASDPSAGWRSRSEMHTAQNPVDPDLLVAGSKFYNRDLLNSLGEYEFKVGSYASFDGGGSWVDLGQVATCPPEQAPPESWPTNECYPDEDPNRDGLDKAEQGEAQHPQDGDYGEEYITSDPWVQWDDEGNAYYMVLDHPPFGGNPEGNGWGMTLHRWDSVSEDDVAAGETWGPRMPINFYPNELTREIALDDKNTFAVNNAGPDGDGQTGIIVACWGQTIDPLIKQQVLCKRSVDKGETWFPPEGVPASQPVSDVEQLVIGVHVVASKVSPTTFYATWLQYATGIAPGAPSTIEFAVSEDGGQTWVHRQLPVTPINDIPRQFPGQSFRNLSIPIMAVGPQDELYITYPEYVNASRPAQDEDGKEADIRLVKSTNGGVTWSGPTTVNPTDESPNPNADQFQPYVDVTESGQVNVAYFDRRLDTRVTEGDRVVHPGNYFTDVFLARSNDGGGTFTDVRLTHDATDPEFNAPISPSGKFFGDYQGLAVNDCEAIPFFNDTHLANDEFLDPGPVRDPEFDDGLPSSPYQEAVSWNVPNTSAFGGPGAQLPEGCGEDVDPPPPAKCPGREDEPGNHFVGTRGDDVMTGTPRRDVMCGRGGDDTLAGRAGNDLILGGPGLDTLVGGDGRDRIFGNRGSDALRGLKGNDVMRDASGINSFKGGPGHDRMAGGRHIDSFFAGGGRDVMKGGRSHDFAAGGDGNDRIVGGSGRDDLRGYDGNDDIAGGSGNDLLEGGRGADILRGQGGNDVCRGNAGADVYRGCEQRQ